MLQTRCIRIHPALEILALFLQEIDPIGAVDSKEYHCFKETDSVH